VKNPEEVYISMEETEPKDLALDLLKGELDRVSTSIRDSGSTYDRLLSLAAVIFGGGLTIGLEQGRKIVLVLLPLPIVLLIVYGFQILIEQNSQGGYKKFLEEQVGRLSDTNLLFWEREVAPQVGQKSWTDNYVVPGMYFAFLSGTWIVSLTALWSTYPSWRWAGFLGLAISAAFVATGHYESSSARQRAYGYASQAAAEKSGDRTPA
jgi:hypothetical protein